VQDKPMVTMDHL